MSYLLYLKRSFTRSPRRHATLPAVLTCAFLLPLLLAIYRDSCAYGTRQDLLTRSAGETYHIGNAAEVDAACFEDIPGLSAPVYRDGAIYLRVLSDEEWKNHERMLAYDQAIHERIEASGNERLISARFSYEYAHGISTDPAHYSQQRILLLLNVLAILLSTCVVYSAYQSHLRRFSADVGMLRACGASRRQIGVLFIAEFLLVFLSSGICAVLISVLTLKALFKAFLEIRHESLAWLIFRVEPLSILLNLAIFFVTQGLTLGMALRRYGRESAQALHSEAGRAGKLGRRRSALRQCATPAATLCRLWRGRTNHCLRSCVRVSVPVVTVFLLLFNVLSISLRVTGGEEEYGLRLSCKGEFAFDETDMAYVASLEGVKQIVPVYRLLDYILLPESSDEVGQTPRIRPYSSLDTSTRTLSGHEIAVSSRAGSGYAVGDELRLCRSEAYYDDSGWVTQPSPEDVTVLTVAVLTNEKPSGPMPDIYISDELYAEMIASEPVTGLEIALTDPALNAQVEASLRARFSGAEYALTNRQSGADFLRGLSSGVYLLLGYLFAALLLLVLLILYVRLCDYIESSRPLIRSLHLLGASKRTLYRSYIGQAQAAAMAAVLAPFLISLLLTAALCVWQKAPLALHGGMPAGYAASAAMLLAVYLSPVRRSMNRVLRTL